jgi:hypothetical protein
MTINQNNTNNAVNVRAERQRYRKWRGNDYQLALAINAACAAGGAPARRYFEMALTRGNKVEDIEGCLKGLSEGLILRYVGSDWYINAKKGLYDPRIEKILANMKAAIARKVQYQTRRVLVGLSATCVRPIYVRVRGYCSWTVETLLAWEAARLGVP